MMFYIQNRGEIDIAALTLIGATSKEGDDSKIGFFGSGNKYALAALLRHKVGVRIFSGLREISVETTNVDFRGTQYEQIHLDGVPTSFTTRLGPQWEVWMGLREFVCNAVDEGSHDYGEREPEGVEGCTMIYVAKTPETRKFFLSMDEFLAFDRPALDVFHVNSTDGPKTTVKVLERMEEEAPAQIFRKGVKCDDGRFSKSVFDYDLERVSINESRILNSIWEISYAVVQALAQLKEKDQVRKVLDALRSDVDFFEQGLVWKYAGQYSNAWRETIGSTMLVQDDLARFAPGDSVAAALVLPSELVKGLKTQYPEINAMGLGTTQGLIEHGTLDEYEKIKRAFETVVGWFPKANTLKIQPCKFAADATMTIVENGTLYINVNVEHKTYEEVERMLFEQCALYEAGGGFGTRGYEEFLAKLCIRTLKELENVAD